MKLTEVFTNEFARVEINKQWKFILITWLQHTQLEPMRQVLEEALKFAREEQINYWLFDLRKLNYIMLTDQIWTANKYFTKFDMTLHNRLACVVNSANSEMFPDTAIQENMQQHDELTQQVQLEIFTDMEMARFWLFD